MSEEVNHQVPEDAAQAAEATAMLKGEPPPASPEPPPAPTPSPETPTASPEPPTPVTTPVPAASPEPKPDVPVTQPPVDIAKLVAETVKSTLSASAPKPEPAKAPEAAPWKPFHVDAKFVDSLIEDSEKGATVINQMIDGVIKSTLELVLPYVNQTVQPLIERSVQSDIVAARQEFAKTYPDMSSEGDIQWAEEVARQLVQQGQKFSTNKEFFEAVYNQTKALKDTYRKRLGVTSNAPAAPIPNPTTVNGPRGSKVSLSDEQKEMLVMLGKNPDNL